MSAEDMLFETPATPVETLPDLVERLSKPPYKGLIRDYEFEDAMHSYLHAHFGELFKREVQVGDEQL